MKARWRGAWRIWRPTVFWACDPLGRPPLGGDLEQQWRQGRHDLPNR